MVQDIGLAGCQAALRRARSGDEAALYRIEAVRHGWRNHYRQEQIDAWCGSLKPAYRGHALKLREHLVAETERGLAGFGQLDLESGNVDALYVAPGVPALHMRKERG